MKPYWLLGKRATFPSLKKDMRADVVVIGGGITGASVCYWLADKCRVVMLEEDMMASKASGRNAGFLLTGTSDYYNKAIERYGHEVAGEVWKITQNNHDLLEEQVFCEDDCDHKRCGSYLVAASKKEMQDIAESVELLRKDGFSYKLINASEINSILSSKGFHGGAFNARDGEVNPVKLVNALADKSKENGVDIFEKTKAQRITAKEDRFSVKTRHGTVTSDFIVLAANAYTPILDSYFKDKILPIRGQMLATNPIEKKFEGVFYANYGYEYWRQMPNGRIIAGGFRELDFAREKGYRMITTKNIQKNLEDMLRQFSLEFDVEYRWSGIMGFSKDRLPIIGSLPSKKNLLVSAGYSGHGLGFAFIAGRMIAETILNGKQVSELFSPSRFC